MQQQQQQQLLVHLLPLLVPLLPLPGKLVEIHPRHPRLHPHLQVLPVPVHHLFLRLSSTWSVSLFFSSSSGSPRNFCSPLTPPETLLLPRNQQCGDAGWK